MLYFLSKWGVISISILAKPFESATLPVSLGLLLSMPWRPPALPSLLLTSLSHFLPLLSPNPRFSFSLQGLCWCLLLCLECTDSISFNSCLFLKSHLFKEALPPVFTYSLPWAHALLSAGKTHWESIRWLGPFLYCFLNLELLPTSVFLLTRSLSPSSAGPLLPSHAISSSGLKFSG